jgi:hypothetical protein
MPMQHQNFLWILRILVDALIEYGVRFSGLRVVAEWTQHTSVDAQ